MWLSCSKFEHERFASLTRYNMPLPLLPESAQTDLDKRRMPSWVKLAIASFTSSPSRVMLLCYLCTGVLAMTSIQENIQNGLQPWDDEGVSWTNLATAPVWCHSADGSAKACDTVGIVLVSLLCIASLAAWHERPFTGSASHFASEGRLLLRVSHLQGATEHSAQS